MHVLIKLASRFALMCVSMSWLALTSSAYADSSVLDRVVDLDIPAQQLTPALFALSKQAGIQVITSPEVVGNQATAGVNGHLTIREALTKLLQGTKLGFHQAGENTIGIDPSMNKSDRDPSARDEVVSSTASSLPIDGSYSTQVADQSGAEVKLKAVEVTGSRLPRTAKEGAQEVHTYSKEQIEQSGRTTVADFLNTLPTASINISENGNQTGQGATTVQLHGLPLGTTLVLINGRRLEPSASQQSFGPFFDLNNIPLAAVERIEVLSEGSSAVYGSDAIAGVVNIVLKSKFNGFESSAKYGWASGTDETDAYAGWGRQWDRGGLLVIGSFQGRSELDGFERSITANNNYSQYGGTDNRQYFCDPGNVFSTTTANLPGTSSTYAAVPKGFQGTPSLQEFANTGGTLNQCSVFGYSSQIPPTQREGLLASGRYELASFAELFTEILYSHTRETSYGLPNFLFGEPGFQSFTVSAANPFNPFGETVGISGLLISGGRLEYHQDSTYLRPLIGIRGTIHESWQWEMSGWQSRERSHNILPTSNDNAIQAALNSSDPSTALNPFIDGPYGASSLVQSLVQQDKIDYFGNLTAASGFVRGPIHDFGSGPIQAAVGGEYDRNTLYTDIINEVPFYPPNTQSTYHRDNYAVFGEARIPVVANHSNPQAGDILALSAAGRYDNYNDFGHKTTPQLGAEFRPWDSILLRSTYGRAFKAPSLYDLYSPQSVTPVCTLTDPTTGQSVVVSCTTGGNPKLHPEEGQSRTFGIVYSSRVAPGLQLSMTHWGIDEKNSIQLLSPQIILNNESSFPGNVTRNSSGAVTSVNSTYVNFGQIDVRGMDFQLNYVVKTAYGQFQPSIAATETYHYTSALIPGTSTVDKTSKANDDGNWAPRWKGTVGLVWKREPFTASVDGRYVGRYQDYDSTNQIGDFWLYDANVRVLVGHWLAPNDELFKKAFIEIGGVNIFNSLPQYSNYFFGHVGYDAAQADIRGRFLYAQLGVKW